MGRCSCSGASACSCVIEGGDGIRVTGSGTLSNPYTIVSTAVVERYIQTLDTQTLDLVLEGGGTPSNPFVISGEATLRAPDRAAGGDGQVPVTGDVMVWVVDHWEFQPPPSGGGDGSGGLTGVTTGAGVSGSGTGASPLRAAVSGVWGSGSMANFPTDQTLGVPIYTDAAGQLRARPAPILRYAVNPIGSFTSGKWKASDGTVFWYQMGQEVYFRTVVARSGSSISVGSGADGNIANEPIGVLASGLPTPLAGEWPALVSGTGMSLNVYADGNRNLMLSSIPPNAKISTNDVFSIVGHYWTGEGGVVL